MIVKGWADSPFRAGAFVAGFMGCLVGAKIVIAVTAGRSRQLLCGQMYLYVMRLLGMLLLVFAGMLIKDGLTRSGCWACEIQSREREIMDPKVKEAIYRAVEREPFARALKMELVELDEGFSAVEMTYEPAGMDNMFGRAHGGALFALIDEAFETVCQTYGTVTVALNVSVTYVTSPEAGTRLARGSPGGEQHQADRRVRHQGHGSGGAADGHLPGAGVQDGQTVAVPLDESGRLKSLQSNRHQKGPFGVEGAFCY